MMIPNASQRLACEQSFATAGDGLLCFLSGLRAIKNTKSVHTMLDVGCGAGHFVQTADSIGIKALGLDICVEYSRLMPNGSEVWYADLSEEVFFHDHGPFDLVLCLEVAEHMHEYSVGQLMKTCTKGLSKGGVLLFSAATPGQGGAGHVNEQENDHWYDKFMGLGLFLNDSLTYELRATWTELAPNSWWYGKNVMAFEALA